MFLAPTFSTCWQLSDSAAPLAWQGGDPYGLLIELSISELSSLGQAFMRGCLMLEEELEVVRMMSVSFTGQPQQLLHDSQLCSAPASRRLHLCRRTAETTMAPPSDASTKGGTSVAPAGAPYRAPSTAPNVLVYTGAGEDSARRYQLARGALSLCLNPDSYAIYRLTSEQALGAPWVGGATLLLVSCDHLQPGVEETMMRYFATGGRLLSVCSPLDQRFVGVQPMRKTQRRRRVVVTATTPAGCDARLLSQGRWYDTRDVLMPSLSVEAVVADKDTQHTLVAEVRSTETGGCAMLSQVRLDMEPAEAGVSEDMFTSLKQANSARIDTVRHLLERMGMDCTPHEQPCLTPAYLYTKSEAVKQRLLSALNPSLVNGVLQSKVVSLRFTSDPTVTSDLTATSDTVTSPDVAVTPDLLPVIHRDHTVIPSNGNCSVFHKERGGGGGRHGDATTWAFDEVAYFKSLDTEVLGQAVMFCEVVPTTMTLFDRLMFVTPADTGVVAIARQQTAGRGRSGNAWISPRGCAMFSAVVRVPLMSVLGKRTPFLQHLMALAIVEAVRSEPGYECPPPSPDAGCGQLASTVTPLGVTVTLADHGLQQVTVEGLDEYGYLVVRTRLGDTISVQPDGNSFDMLHRVISVKPSR
ncbi:PREDICTED: biotin--protein ligase-like [Priapulus caudatus]|uniref:Biotin--protein ligase-like n=1 Tax=Priapulus caudatus TaxID=37621 RepID=A0ABM1E5E4_PRICU|nr:PREDICTED: biotin--protein ligase-like [Priapulus caudatus]